VFNSLSGVDFVLETAPLPVISNDNIDGIMAFPIHNINYTLYSNQHKVK
jgi:hypothetical protein